MIPEQNIRQDVVINKYNYHGKHVLEQNIRQDEVINKYKYHGKHATRAEHKTIWGSE